MKRSSIIALVCLLVATIVGFFGGYKVAMRSFPDITEHSDTTHVVDTIPFYKPVPKDSIVLRYVEVPVPVSVNDSVTNPSDSVTNIKIAIESLIYDEDSTYYAVVSGPTIGDYHPSLDTLKVYRETVMIETTKTITAYKPYKWSISPFVSQEVGLCHYMAQVGVEADFGFKNDRFRFVPEVGYQWTSIDKGGWYAGAKLKFDLVRKR